MIVALCFLLISTTLGDVSDIGLNPTQMIENHGYPSETHQITTNDGYILTYHRIPSSTNQVVLLMHGYPGSSADFLFVGPSRGLGYLLADLGYDVWLANARGNAFSRNHTSIDPDLDGEKFYNFTWHQMGVDDLPTAIDYILNVTGEESLQFIGHSQGATAFLVLVCTKPEYNKKVKLASLMAAAAFIGNSPNLIFQMVSKYVDWVEVLLKKLEIWELPFTKAIRDFVVWFCADPGSHKACDLIYHLEFQNGEVEEEELAVIFSNNPSNAGIKQLIHFGQLVRDGQFRCFDFGVEGNLKEYGSETPPDYNLLVVTTPIAFYYAQNDKFIAYEDSQKLVNMVANVASDYLVPDHSFNHCDFLYGKNITDLVYNELFRVMSKYQ